MIIQVNMVLFLIFLEGGVFGLLGDQGEGEGLGTGERHRERILQDMPVIVMLV